MITNSDLTTQAIEWALSGLEQRSAVIANNVANAEVPDFAGKKVEFEGQLAAALNAGRITRMAEPVVLPTGSAPGANGNNVQLEDEMVGMIQTNLMKSAMIEAFNYKADILRMALRNQ
ncbi:MAG: flagellar biosynthesis protein FlgB [Acidimicrobiia bacterium]|nr:flagellar biosynthesis protein FlgB [Acidimicrobiia bacterium]MDH4309332.1 flagellar biosynthesis protein FlgB [Acidimicrobiia bacterium]MDH5292973.1 flagellar biosynthesis protein FlgB [Acidimicrobiia bacterium]MDH5521554.1 flagellar biosynthesis protein FlgB [Acidimicrobiia bacterium]